MCFCFDGITGSDYTEQCIVEYKDKKVQCDPCLVGELVSLWRQGINTTASCCGHNQTNGGIIVDFSSIHKMEELGYEKDLFADYHCPGRRDAFLAKSFEKIHPNTPDFVKAFYSLKNAWDKPVAQRVKEAQEFFRKVFLFG